MGIAAGGKLGFKRLIGLAIVQPGNAVLSGALSKIFSPSCWATQPSTANFLPWACSFL
jgi:hypothetical protein